MTTLPKHAILNFGEHKLCIAINPKIEADRGFIRFFNKEDIAGWSEDNIVNFTELNGNSLLLESALMFVKSIEDNDFKIIEDKETITRPSGGSWYNSQTMHSSVCFFRYIDSKSQEQKLALVDMHEMNTVKYDVNIDEKLAEDIVTGTVYQLPNTLLGRL